MGHPVDQRSDIYSLGVVLYEMLIGQVPFHADSQVGVAMKHVNEELPDVQQRRPELSAAAALVVERATAKDPAERYQEVGELIADLSTALEVEAARAGSTTGEATTVLEAVPPAERKLRGGHRRSWLAIALLVLVAGAILLAVQLIGGGDSGGGGGALKGKGNTIPLSGASDYDPQGDGEEDPEGIGFAIDGNPTGTAWSSEHYDTPTFAGTKTGPDPGMGLYVITKSAVKPAEMIIRTPSPGWDAEIFAAASGPPEELQGWGEPVATVSDAKELNEVELHLEAPAKYFLIWFNKAASARDQEGRYQVEISDVKLID
jgi:serine/threonine-protein kinase